MSSECRSGWASDIRNQHTIASWLIPRLDHKGGVGVRGERREEGKQEGKTAPKIRSAKGPRAPACGPNTTTRQSRGNLPCSNRQTLPVSLGERFLGLVLGLYPAPHGHLGFGTTHTPRLWALSGSSSVGRSHLAPTEKNGEHPHLGRHPWCRHLKHAPRWPSP